MSFPVSFHPEAAHELDEVVFTYEQCRPTLGADFYRDLHAKIQQAVAHPARFSPYLEVFRRLKFKRWPYFVVYGHDDQRLVVLGIFHSARDPRWIAQQLRNRG